MPLNINISDIIRQLQEAQTAANAANEARYQQGLATLTGGRQTLQNLYGQAGSLIGEVGKSAIEDISRGAVRQGGQTRQDLITSGLANTTIAGAMARGVEEDRRRSMRQVEEDQARLRSGLATQQAGAEMGAAGGIADFIASRSDVAPDMSIYSSLIQAASAQEGAPSRQNPITVRTMGANARAGLDAFGRPLGRFSSGGGGGAGGGGGFANIGQGGGGGGGAAGTLNQAQYFAPGVLSQTAPGNISYGGVETPSISAAMPGVGAAGGGTAGAVFGGGTRSMYGTQGWGVYDTKTGKKLRNLA